MRLFLADDKRKEEARKASVGSGPLQVLLDAVDSTRSELMSHMKVRKLFSIRCLAHIGMAQILGVL